MPYANPTDRAAAQRRYRLQKSQGGTEPERRLSAEVERLRTALGELPQTVERLEAELACATAGLARAERARESAETENARLGGEVERLSRLRFPMAVFEPNVSFRTHVFRDVGHLALFRTHPEAMWERSEMLVERRREATVNHGGQRCTVP